MHSRPTEPENQSARYKSMRAGSEQRTRSHEKNIIEDDRCLGDLRPLKQTIRKELEYFEPASALFTFNRSILFPYLFIFFSFVSSSSSSSFCVLVAALAIVFVHHIVCVDCLGLLFVHVKRKRQNLYDFISGTRCALHLHKTLNFICRWKRLNSITALRTIAIKW